jgi:uncharacterized membrane protein YadS
VAFAWFFGNPWPEQTQAWATRLLQCSVIDLGAGMSLRVVVEVGSVGVVQTMLGLTFALLAALVLMMLLRCEPNASLLTGVGTAICGGSAIAAVG